VIFTGDTLFIAGCGVFFEGTGAKMHYVFERLRVAALPDATVTYVGHEYTAGNLRFARSVDPENAALVRLVGLVDQHPVTVGRMTIGDEKEWNVFWRLTGEPGAVRKNLRHVRPPFMISKTHLALLVLYFYPHFATCRAATKAESDAISMVPMSGSTVLYALSLKILNGTLFART
jgi:hypothetical protein